MSVWSLKNVASFILVKERNISRLYSAKEQGVPLFAMIVLGCTYLGNPASRALIAPATRQRYVMVQCTV